MATLLCVILVYCQKYKMFHIVKFIKWDPDI